MSVIAEHDEAILTRDMPERGLKRGDIGTVVSVQYAQDGTAVGYTLEISTITGESLGVVNVEAASVRKPGDDDLPSTRSLSASA